MIKRSRLFLLLLLITFVLMHIFFPSSRKNQADASANLFERGVAWVFEPVSQTFSVATGYFGTVLEDYLFLVNIKKENKQLKESIQLIKIQNRSLHITLAQETQIKTDQKAYSFLGRDLKRIHVTGFDLFSPSKTLWIDHGIQDGIELNSVVLSGDGLVGRVIKVYDRSSQVLLLIDGMYAVDVINERTQLRCMVKGVSSGSLKAKSLPFLSQIEYKQRGHVVQKDDQLVTSGMGGLYPAGIPVGQVLKVDLGPGGNFEKSLVMPAVDFMRLNHLYVLSKKLSSDSIKKVVSNE